ncbi:MAG: hypothetical protein QNI87_15345 [Erythrobacter sp.]|uniref:hypothetical protein n=1 Tax=Erythrobacter sp. TaxID=1042 RepID=UPI002609EBD9|nr:hypothetical protein [Erythrobacter sp.]MDJ0979900.1 hypothetical protein [Erythrobacter sp.]
MAARNFLERLGNSVSPLRVADGDEAPENAPLGGTRAEATQRLQVGLTGLCAMILVIGIASILGGQADIAEEAAVPDAAPTTEPSATPAQRDPLADAGVVPDIPAQPEAIGTDAEKPDDAILTDEDGAVTVPDTPPSDLQDDARGTDELQNDLR